MDCSSQQPLGIVAARQRGRRSRKEQEATDLCGRRPPGGGGRAIQRGPNPAAACWARRPTRPVYGAFVTLKRGGQLRSCCGASVKRCRFAEALDRAADRAATDDPRFPPISPTELNQLDMDVWILWGPEPVAARGEDRVQAVVIGKHGVQIARGARPRPAAARRGRRSWPRCAGFPATGLHQGRPADRRLERRRHDAAGVRGRRDGRPVGSEGLAMKSEQPDVRPPAVAGGFYPGTAGEVQRMARRAVRRGAAAGGRSRGPARWFRTPAGIYSGRLAAAVFQRVAIPECVIILCPKHRPGGAAVGGGAAPAVAVSRRRIGLRSGAGRAAGRRRDRAGSSMRRPIARNTPSRCNCRCWPDWRRRLRVVGIAVGDRPLPELLRFGVTMSVVSCATCPAPVAGRFQRHEPFCRRGRDAAAGSTGAGRHRNARSGARSTKRCGKTASACAAWPLAWFMEALRWLDA